MLLSFSIINTCNHLCRVEARTAWKGNCFNFVFELSFFLLPAPLPDRAGSGILEACSLGAGFQISPNAGPVWPEVQTGFVWTVLWSRGWLVEQDMASPRPPLHCGSQGFSVLVIGTDCVPVVVCFSDKYSIWVWVNFTVQKQTFILSEEPWALFLYFPKQCFQ